MDDLNICCEVKLGEKAMKEIMNESDLTHLVKEPTWVTSSSKTQTDLGSSNKPESNKTCPHGYRSV